MLWTPGQILKTRPYRIDTILAQGGFGLTYKATHLQLNHPGIRQLCPQIYPRRANLSQILPKRASWNCPRQRFV